MLGEVDLMKVHVHSIKNLTALLNSYIRYNVLLGIWPSITMIRVLVLDTDCGLSLDMLQWLYNYTNFY